MRITKVLIVDDFQPFRRFIIPMLKQEDGLEIVGEAGDGLEAVQKIEELQPDLILLDIGLPSLNGIKVAMRAKHLAPNARVLFVSQEFSFDMVREAVRLGVLGYVHKQRVIDDLLPAIRDVLSGKPFVSSGLKEYEASEAERLHEIVFGSNPEVLLQSFTDFIAAAQKAGRPAILIATQPHLEDVSQRLRALGLRVDAAIEAGRFVPLEVTEVLSSFMGNDMPDPARFFNAAIPLIEGALKVAEGYRPRLAACGECAPTLLAQGNVAAAIRVEQLWDHLARTFKIDILCGYMSETLDGTDDDSVSHSLCAEHSLSYSR